MRGKRLRPQGGENFVPDFTVLIFWWGNQMCDQ